MKFFNKKDTQKKVTTKLPMTGKVKFWVYPFLDLGAAELALKRKLSLPVSRM